MLCTYVVGDTSDCGSSGVGAPQGALSPVWTGQSGLERVVHYSNLPVCTTRLVSSHHAVTQADVLSPSQRQLRNSAALMTRTERLAACAVVLSRESGPRGYVFPAQIPIPARLDSLWLPRHLRVLLIMLGSVFAAREHQHAGCCRANIRPSPIGPADTTRNFFPALLFRWGSGLDPATGGL